MSELLSPPANEPSLRFSQTQKDLIAGSIGGIAQVLVGQVSLLLPTSFVLRQADGCTDALKPFDLTKVRLQTSPPGTYAGTVDCVQKVLKREGPLAFYKVCQVCTAVIATE